MKADYLVLAQYETASKRFYKGQNIACLIYLSRAWYQKASKDQSFDAVRAALKASQQVSCASST